MFQPAVAVPADLLQQHNIEFTRKAWRVGLRPDQRGPHQVRPLSVEFTRGPLVRRIIGSETGGARDDASVDVSTLAHRQNSTRVQLKLGATHVSASIHCHLVEPLPNQPKHGFFEIQVKHITHERNTTSSSTAGGDINTNPDLFPSSSAQLRQFLLKLFKGGVIDTEGLCVVPGQHVWSLTVNCTVLHNDGNALDACQLAVLALLLAHRRPEAVIIPAGQRENGEGVRLYEEWERDPAPLSLLHTPLSCSFALTEDPHQRLLEERRRQQVGAPTGIAVPLSTGLDLVADPTLEEAAAAVSSITVVVNREGQVCAMEKGGGPSVSLRHIMDCLRLAAGAGGIDVSGGEGSENSEEPDASSRSTAFDHSIAGYWWSVLDKALKQLELDRQSARQTQFQWAKQRTGVSATPAAPPTSSTSDTVPVEPGAQKRKMES